MKTYKKRPKAVELRVSDTRIRINARICFFGQTDLTIDGQNAVDLIKQGLERQLSAQNPKLANMAGTSYDFPEKLGQRIKLSLRLEETDSKPSVRYYLIAGAGVSCTLFFPTWRAQKNKHIVLFTGDVRNGGRTYTAGEYANVAAHEFGHAMGIADLYGGLAPYALCRRPPAPITPEMPVYDLMRTCFGEAWFTPNDLEMALLAQEENAPQSHFAHRMCRGINKKSDAVRL